MECYFEQVYRAWRAAWLCGDKTWISVRIHSFFMASYVLLWSAKNKLHTDNSKIFSFLFPSSLPFFFPQLPGKEENPYQEN